MTVGELGTGGREGKWDLPNGAEEEKMLKKELKVESETGENERRERVRTTETEKKMLREENRKSETEIEDGRI